MGVIGMVRIRRGRRCAPPPERACALTALALLLLGMGCGHSIRSTDEQFWQEYAQSFHGLDTNCLYSEQRDADAFTQLVGEVQQDSDRLSAEFDAVHYTLPDDHPLSRRARAALERIKPQLVSRRRCSSDRAFAPEGISARVIAHDVPAAFVFPNGRIYLTTGLVDPDLPWSARTDDELLGVIAHEAVHLVDYHIVIHWTVVRRRNAEQMAQLPLMLTWVLPIRLKAQALPLGAETYDQRIEFLADSGAVELLRGIGRRPDGYRTFLQRLAGYPYFDQIGQPQRRDLLIARTTCLDACLSPSRAARRDDNGALRRLTAHDQFVLCAKSYVAIGADDWPVVADWLRQPGSTVLDELPERLHDRGERAALAELVSAQRLGEGPVIARAGLGERAQLEDGCRWSVDPP